MIDEYSVNFRSIVSHAKYLIYYWIGLILFFMIFIYINGLDESLVFLQTTSVIAIIISSPIVSLLIQYYTVNRNVKININKEIQNISIFNNNIWDNFSFSDILLFEKNYSKPLFRDEEPVYPWESLNYVKIELSDGRTYYITCLLVDLLDIRIPDKIKVKREKVFPFIY